jgi:hypothetical protein
VPRPRLKARISRPVERKPLRDNIEKSMRAAQKHRDLRCRTRTAHIHDQEPDATIDPAELCYPPRPLTSTPTDVALRTVGNKATQSHSYDTVSAQHHPYFTHKVLCQALRNFSSYKILLQNLKHKSPQCRVPHEKLPACQTINSQPSNES